MHFHRNSVQIGNLSNPIPICRCSIGFQYIYSTNYYILYFVQVLHYSDRRWNYLEFLCIISFKCTTLITTINAIEQMCEFSTLHFIVWSDFINKNNNKLHHQPFPSKEYKWKWSLLSKINEVCWIALHQLKFEMISITSMKWENHRFKVLCIIYSCSIIIRRKFLEILINLNFNVIFAEFGKETNANAFLQHFIWCCKLYCMSTFITAVWC